MSVFEKTLRSRVEQVQEAIVETRQAGHDYAAELHGARLADLLDLAARNGVDTTDWVDPAVTKVVAESLSGQE